MFEYSWRFLHTNKYKIHVFIYFGNWNMEIENEHLENQIKNLNRFFPSEPAGSSGSPIGLPVQAV